MNLTGRESKKKVKPAEREMRKQILITQQLQLLNIMMRCKVFSWGPAPNPPEYYNREALRRDSSP